MSFYPVSIKFTQRVDMPLKSINQSINQSSALDKRSIFWSILVVLYFCPLQSYIRCLQTVFIILKYKFTWYKIDLLIIFLILSKDVSVDLWKTVSMFCYEISKFKGLTLKRPTNSK